MAIAFNNLGNTNGLSNNQSDNPDINDTSTSISYANSSWTPPSGGMILVVVHSREAGTGPAEPSISGNGLTWTKILGPVTDGDGDGGLTLFAADASSPSTGVTTVSFTLAQIHCTALFCEVTGADLSSGVAAAFAQLASAPNQSAATSGSVSLASGAGDSGNRCFAAFHHIATDLNTPRTNWTELDDAQGTGRSRSIITEYRGDAFEQTSSASWSTSSSWCGLIVEIKVEGAVSVTYNQTHFRIRSQDAAGLNTDGGWLAAEDTNATVGTGELFRIRFRITETAGVGSSNTFKLQVNRNSTSWGDCGVLGTGSAPPVLVRASSQYADGDATSTQLLTSSGGSYVNGQGDSNNSVSSSISSQETEVEFCLQILGFHDGPAQNIANDTLQFRIVEGGGVVFTGSYTIPTVTVSETPGYIGGTYVEHPSNIGPIRDSNGNLYTIIEPSVANNVLMMIKSTNGGSTWREMDGSNRPTENDVENIDIFQDGDTLHIIHNKSAAYYHRFRTSDHSTNPDTWEITDEVIDNSITGHVTQCGTIAKRSDGTIIAVYVDDANPTAKVRYKIRNGTWGSQNTLDTENSHMISPYGVLGANDKFHVVYKDDSNGILYHRSINSSGTLGTRHSIATGLNTAQGGDNIPHVPPVYYDDNGTERILVMYQKTFGAGPLFQKFIDDDGTPGTELQVSDNNVEQSEGGNAMVIASVGVYNKVAYVVYSEKDVYDLWTTSSDNGAAYETDTEIKNNVTAHWVRGNVINNSGTIVFAFTWDDGSDGGTGQIWYNEVLISGGTDTKTINENLTFSDSQTLTATLSIGDSLTFSETVPISAQISLSDSLTFTDLPFISQVLQIADTLGITDSQNINVDLSVEDSLTLVDSTSVLVSLNVSDSLTISDTIELAYLIAVFDTLSLSDTNPISVFFSVNDSLGISDNQPIQAALNVSDNLTLQDTVSSTVSLQISDPLTIIDSLNIQVFGTVSDPFSITDSPSVPEILLEINESLGLIESLEISTIVPISESLNIQDTVSAYIRILANDIIGFSENTSITALTLVPENVGINDSLVIQASVSVSESISISDDIYALILQTINEVIGITDSPLISTSLSIGDSLSISDQTSIAVNLTLNDTLTLEDSVDVITAALKTINDVLSLSEGIGIEVYLSQPDSLTFSEQENISTNIPVSDIIAFVDSETVNVTITLSDTISFDENINVIAEIVKTVNDTLTFSESRTITVTLSVPDSLSINDVINLVNDVAISPKMYFKLKRGNLTISLRRGVLDFTEN